MGARGSLIKVGERTKLMGVQKKKELERKRGEVASVVQEQGKVRVRLDCGKHVLVSAERVARGQGVEHVNEAADPTATQQVHQEDERGGREAVNKGRKRAK